MKRILVILLVISFVSCQNRITVDGDIVVKVEKWSDTKSLYYTNGLTTHAPQDNELPSFIAPIGLYNVRDTIHFSK